MKPDIDNGFYSWACFKAHQAAEAALKALLRGLGAESFGHDLLALWRRAREYCGALRSLEDCIMMLNKMYIPPRYPDAWPGESAPFESYSRGEALSARDCAERVYNAVERCLSPCT